jgi:transposase-like protein
VRLAGILVADTEGAGACLEAVCREGDTLAERAQAYSIEDKEAAVAAYVVGGTFSRAETITGIKADTISKWRERDPAWWAEVEHKIRVEHEQEHRARLRDIIEAGMAQLLDRVANGDYAQDEAGNYTIRKPMTGKDLTIATGTMVDKLRVSLGQATSIAGKSTDSATDKLDALRKAAVGAAREQAKEDGKLVELGETGRASSVSVGPKTDEPETIAA